MKRNCNLELRLVTSSDDFEHLKQSNKSPQQQQQQQQPQKLTIFYNGQVCVCDATELQARAILMLASREVEDKLRSPIGSSRPTSPTLQSQLYSSNGLSMKRSLQRFLQKRKSRIQETSPYNIKRCVQGRMLRSLEI